MMMSRTLELDEAMLDHHDRWEIFRNFIRDHLFDEAMSDMEYVEQMNVRHEFYEAAANRLLALSYSVLDAARHPSQGGCCAPNDAQENASKGTNGLR
jgi:hypothetical protein